MGKPNPNSSMRTSPVEKDRNRVGDEWDALRIVISV